jgi:hypothetical protein
MSDPANKRKRELWMGGWEIAEAAAGLIVFAGLALEIGPEAWGYFITWTLLPREIFGSALVAIGVFAEVAIALRIARSAKQQERESNERIAELNAEAERLRETNNVLQLKIADAELLIMDLRLDQSPRSAIFDTRTFIGVLESNPKGTVEVLYPREDGEAYEFAGLVLRCFVVGHWTVPTDIVPIEEDPTGMNPGIVLAGGRPVGITVRGGGAIEGAFGAAVDAFKAVEWRGRQYRIYATSDMSMKEGSIRIIVGPKL